MSAAPSLRRMNRQLGWPGVLGLGLLVFAASFYLSGLRPAEAYLSGLQSDVESRQRDQKRSAAGGEAPTPAAQLSKFHQAFPDSASQPDWLEKIFTVAAAQGVELEQGDYKLSRNIEGRLVRLHISFPVKSDYPQMRRFIARLKAEIPVLALEHIQFERQKVADPALEVKLQLVLFMEQAR